MAGLSCGVRRVGLSSMHLPLLSLLLAACICCGSGGLPRRIEPGPGVTSRYPTPEAHECYKQIGLNMMGILGPFLDGFKGRTAIMDAAVHSNVGDNMLWLGAKRLLNMYGRTANVLCAGAQFDISQHNFPHCPSPENLLRSLGTPALILWHAGGNFGDLYPWVQDYRNRYMFELDRELRTNKSFKNWNVTLVHLPQSIYYKNTTRLKDDKQLYASFTHLDVHLYTRSRDGYEVWGPQLGLEVKPSPDMVYFLGPQQTMQEPVVDVMLLIRKDREGGFPYDRAVQLATEVFPINKLTFKIDDWPDNRSILTNQPQTNSPANWKMGKALRFAGQGLWADLAEVRMFFGMKMLAQGKLVITNRLHSTVLASMMGIPVIWYSGGQFKGYNKVGETMALAWNSSPVCTDDNLRVWQAAGDTEEESIHLAFKQAIKYFKD